MGDIGTVEQLYQVQFVQDLSAAPLDETTSFGFDFKLVAIYWSFSVTLEETCTVEAVLAGGGGTKLGKQTLSDVDNAMFYPDNPAESLFKAGDEIKVGVTDVGGAGTATVTIIVADR